MRKEGLGRKVHLTGKNRQEEVGGRRQAEGMRQKRLGRKGAFGRRMQKEVGGRRQTRNSKEAGRRHETGKIRKKGAFERQE